MYFSFNRPEERTAESTNVGKSTCQIKMSSGFAFNFVHLGFHFFSAESMHEFLGFRSQFWQLLPFLGSADMNLY